MDWPDILVLTANCVLLAINLFGNGIVCIVIHRNKKSRAHRDLLILNLAYADIAFGVFFSPIRIFSYFHVHPNGTVARWLCKFLTSGMFGWLASTVSVGTLTVLAGERYLAVTKPIFFRTWFTKRRARNIIITIWIIAISFNLPLVFAFDFDEVSMKCYEYFPSNTVAKLFAVFWALSHFFIPAAIMLIGFGLISYSLWTHKEEQQQAVIKSRKKVSKIIACVTVVYVLCWSPEAVFYMSFGEWGSGTIVYAVLETLLLLNSSANPIIYSLWSERFRQHVKKTFTCKKKNDLKSKNPRERSVSMRKSAIVG